MTRKSVLIASGLDPSGGAGFIADSRIVAALGARPVGVVTALTEQASEGLRSVHPVDTTVLSDQLTLLLSDTQVSAVKIGMLGTMAIAGTLERCLAQTAAPVVWDPVINPTRGSVGLYDGSPQETAELLSPHLSVLTPNLTEAAVLSSSSVPTSVEHMLELGATLCERYAPHVVVKGGHVLGPATDVLISREPCAVPSIDTTMSVTHRVHQGLHAWLLERPRITTPGPVHGTGCALSSAIAATLAAGHPVLHAVITAKAYVAEAISGATRAGRGPLLSLH